MIANSVWSLLVDRQERLWICTLQGVSCLDGHRFDNFTTADGLPHGMVIASCEDVDGHIWFGTQAGACRYDGEGWTTYRTEDGLAHDRVRWILQDRRGHMWFGTAAGVSRFDGSSWRSFDTGNGLAGDFVQALTEDADGNIWAASWGNDVGTDPRGGLSRFDGERWTSYTIDDGLPSNKCSAVFQDNAGHIWIGTWDAGVGCFDGQTFQTIDQRDGLGGDMVWAIHEAEPELDLPASTSIVSFEFHGDSERTRADGLVYRHRLQGHEEGWRNTRDRRAEFVDVTPGEYTFEVQAVDQEMAYSETAEMRL